MRPIPAIPDPQAPLGGTRDDAIRARGCQYYVCFDDGTEDHLDLTKTRWRLSATAATASRREQPFGLFFSPDMQHVHGMDSHDRARAMAAHLHLLDVRSDAETGKLWLYFSEQHHFDAAVEWSKAHGANEIRAHVERRCRHPYCENVRRTALEGHQAVRERHIAAQALKAQQAAGGAGAGEEGGEDGVGGGGEGGGGRGDSGVDAALLGPGVEEFDVTFDSGASLGLGFASAEMWRRSHMSAETWRGIRVSSVVKNRQAAKDGKVALLDWIIAVDGVDVSDATMEVVTGMVKAAGGAPVVLRFRREAQQGGEVGGGRRGRESRGWRWCICDSEGESRNAY